MALIDLKVDYRDVGKKFFVFEVSSGQWNSSG